MNYKLERDLSYPFYTVYKTHIEGCILIKEDSDNYRLRCEYIHPTKGKCYNRTIITKECYKNTSEEVFKALIDDSYNYLIEWSNKDKKKIISSRKVK